MTYKPPLHIINKEQKKPKENFGPVQHGEAYKISQFALSYQIKGAMIGLALGMLYCNFYLQYWSEFYLFGGLVLGFTIGWLVGRFFYSSHKS